MTESLRDISVIVPFHGSDLKWKDLLQDLRPLPKRSEIILVGPDEPSCDILSRASRDMLPAVRYVYSPLGRGVQMNSGAKNAENNIFWFLHADSKVPRSSLYSLGCALQTDSNAIYYFDLQFLNDGPKLTALNSVGANLRAHYLGLPFGDQGFVVSRTLFYRIGGFDENSFYGEDQLFVWRARGKRVPLKRIPYPLFTSARRYQAEGWTRATSKRIFMTYKQAAAEALKLMKARAIERTRKI